jgi:hypothetical protein
MDPTPHKEVYALIIGYFSESDNHQYSTGKGHCPEKKEQTGDLPRFAPFFPDHP